jgi:hypothetical protein
MGGDAHYSASKYALLTPPAMKDGHMALRLLHANINLAGTSKVDVPNSIYIS